MSDARPIRRALLSVSDKSGLVDLARALEAMGVVLLSTGGTARALRDAGLEVADVSEITGFPEIMDGRVKTLHPAIHGGLLGRRDNADDRAAMEAHGIAGIDLAVINLYINLYPFEDTVQGGADAATAIENIDIGGPAMIRAAAKNHGDVTVIVDPADYAPLLDELKTREGATTLDFRRRMAAKAYARTGSYDAAIAQWFAGELEDSFPARRVFSGELAGTLRYGENPHQAAALYRNPLSPRIGVATAAQLQGKALSYNNLADTDAAFELVAELDRERPAIAIIKHANPCGVAYGATLAEAWSRALSCDSVSAFGGIVAANRPLDGATAEGIASIFTEVIIAPGADDDARRILAKKKNLRLLVTDGLPDW